MAGTIWWRAVCGDQTIEDAFWDVNTTVDSTNPDFTRCFQNTVLVWVPCVYLWLVAAFYLPYLHKKTTHHTCGSVSKFNVVKMLLGVLLSLTALLDLIKSFSDGSENTPLALYIKPAVYLVSMVLATVLTQLEFRKGITSGGVLFCFWLLLIICGIFPFRSNIMHVDYSDDGDLLIEDLFRFVTFYIFYALVLCQLVLSIFPDSRAAPAPSSKSFTSEEQVPLLGSEKEKVAITTPSTTATSGKECPADTVSFLSRILFLWITKLMIRGYRKDLVFEDLWHLRTEDSSNHIVPEFEKEWVSEMEKTGWNVVNRKDYQQSSAKTANSHSGIPNSHVPHHAKTSKTDPKVKEKSPSLLWVIVRCFGPYYMLGGLYKLTYDIVSFINPQILNLLITYVAMRDPYEWRGYLYAVVLFVISFFRTVIMQQYWNVCQITGMRLRTAIIGTVYRKSLRLNNQSRRDTTVGEIVNLMSVDAQKFQDAPQFMHMVWSTPLTIAIALVFLWQQLGPSVMAGFGIMLLFVPVNGFIAAKTRVLQVSQMKQKDIRIKIMNEVLNGIKVLKLYAWEESFKQRVLDIREKELETLKKAAYLNAVSALSWFMAPYLVALGSFGVYVMISPENILDANKAFVSLSLFNLMQYPLSILPATITYGVNGAVSIGRISRYLKGDEIDEENVQRSYSAGGDAVSIQDGTFSWARDETPVLNKVSLQIKEGSLVGVVGTVGCGKSSLVSAMLGEMEVMKGTVNVQGSVAYIPQQAWIQNMTLKDNILFGKKCNDASYYKILDACAMLPDLKILPGGDQTEIGEKGINLSGGQKQRISLARAVYQDTDLYLLDDPLSAVDAHVGKHIFDQVVGPSGLLRNKTRVLVTNGINFLSQMDMIVVLRNGEISELGSYQELLTHHGAFAEFIATYLRDTENEHDVDPENDPVPPTVRAELMKQISVLSGHNSDGEKSQSEKSTISETGSGRRARRVSHRNSSRKSIVDNKEETKKKEKKKQKNLTEEETVLGGNVKLAVFGLYIKACEIIPFAATVLFYILYLASQVTTNIWLSIWSNDPPTAEGIQNITLRDLRLGVYGGLGIAQAIATCGMSFGLAVASINACRVLHFNLLHNILRAPMSFFDTTPMGRIVNRFSRDIDTLDINIPLALRIWMGTFSGVITTIFIISYSTPIFLSVVVPLGLFYYFVQRFYIATSRQLRRIESVKRSPIFAQFSETITGTSSIRAYRKQDIFIQQSDVYLDRNQMSYYPSIIANRWLGMWLEFISNLIVLFAALFAVIERDQIDAGIAGLSVSYALQVTGCLNMVVRMTSDLETYIVAVERIKEYTECPKESALIVQDNIPPRSWPGEGHVQFQDYSTRYRPGLELVLRNINCEFHPAEKIGIVGRTGAGKSSLTLALFRLIEAATGSVIIDEHNIGNLGLLDLRSKITIIPQDPVLFSGPLRLNLDPFETHTDEELWTSLEHSHLKSFASTLPEGLMYEVAENGENLSVGQRQLVCLARALLRKTKILVLDEATAAVDLETDDLIQTTIRTEFKECTVITIAHRLNTILDYDRVMVLSGGNIVQFDTPSNMLESKTGTFFEMARDAGLV